MNGCRIVRAEAFVHELRTRMPFRYGIAEMHRLPHVFVRVEAEQEGRRAFGLAADHLLPKWFTKNPATSHLDDIAEMREVVLHACALAERHPGGATPFAIWRDLYQEQLAEGSRRGWPPLLAGLGASLIERALIDAFCRLESVPFAVALRENRLGIDLGTIHPELAGRSPAEFLPPRPLDRVTLRHTVGLSDPIRRGDLAAGDWPDDGLPVALDDAIARYGLTRFKIKISADTPRNLERLTAIALLLKEEAGPSHAFTLDGNESYASVDEFRDFWDRAVADPLLGGWFDGHLLFVEQPLHRDATFSDEVARVFAGAAKASRLIIDEADGTLDGLPRALRCGYAGTTHKNCKGVFKSVANLALLKARGGGGILSGEDLTNVGPVALLEDLCVAQSLGLGDLERNGHHYFGGLEAFPEEVRERIARSHPDLYAALPDGCPAVAVQAGTIHSPSVHRIGLGPAFDFDPGVYPTLWDWHPAAAAQR